MQALSPGWQRGAGPLPSAICTVASLRYGKSGPGLQVLSPGWHRGAGPLPSATAVEASFMYGNNGPGLQVLSPGWQRGAGPLPSLRIMTGVVDAEAEWAGYIPAARIPPTIRAKTRDWTVAFTGSSLVSYRNLRFLVLSIGTDGSMHIQNAIAQIARKC